MYVCVCVWGGGGGGGREKLSQTLKKVGSSLWGFSVPWSIIYLKLSLKVNYWKSSAVKLERHRVSTPGELWNFLSNFSWAGPTYARCPPPPHKNNAWPLIWCKLKAAVLTQSAFIFSEFSYVNLNIWHKAVQNRLKVRRAMATEG